MSKVIAIGLDGFEPSIAHSLVAQGRLPFFARLFETAACFDLDHGDARYTGLAWEHFSTGRSPEEYGRWSAVSFDRDTYSIVQKSSRYQPFTADLDCRVLAFDVPYHELNAENTVGLANWGAHDPGIYAHSRPDGLRAEIEERFGPYPAKRYIYGFAWPDPMRTRDMATKLVQSLELRGRIADWLMTERLPDWDLAILVVSEFHSGLEALWHGWDETHPLHAVPSAKPAGKGIVDLYVTMDRILGQMQDRFPDAVLSLFSPHGMGPNFGDVTSMALLPEVMHRDAFGTPYLRKLPGAAMPEGVALVHPADWSRSVLEFLGPPRPRGLHRTLLKLKDRLTAPRKADTSAGEDLPLSWMPAAHYQSFWPQMSAFALPSFYDGRIRVNLRGREANGIVPLDRYEAELDRLEALVLDLRDLDTGEPVVERTARPVATDPLSAHESQCDLQVVWNRICVGLRHPRLGEIGPLPHRRPGGHTGGHGFAAFQNAAARPGFHGTRSTFDFVPTLVDLLGSQAGPNIGVTGHSMLPDPASAAR